MKINQSMFKITAILLKGLQILLRTETGNTFSTHKSEMTQKIAVGLLHVLLPYPFSPALTIPLLGENDKYLQEENCSAAKAVQYTSSFRTY